MKPTDSEVKEFWESCGLRTEYEDEVQYWYDPDGTLIGKGFWEWSPPIDLNNLFRYATPLLDEFLDIDTEIIPLLEKWIKASYLEDKDPAPALFWAIKEAT